MSTLPPTLPEEAERMEALRRYEVLDTAADPEFDHIAELASIVCQTPIALITLVDERRQWFKARVGLDIESTARDAAFCAHAIATDDLMVVPDAMQDSRFATNPLVLGDPKIRFYAGAPIVTPDGYRIGTVCAIDREPRELSPTQQAALGVLAKMAVDHLEARLSDRERLRRETAERARAGVAVLDAGGRILLVNDSFKRMLHRNEADLAGKDLVSFVESDPFGLWEHLRDLIDTRTSDDMIEVTLGRPDGTTIDVEMSAVPLDPGGHGALELTLTDATRRVRLERVARDTSALLQDLIDQAPAAVFIKDAGGRYVLVNRAFEQGAGLTRQQLVGSRDVDVLPSVSVEQIRANDRAVIQTGEVRDFEELVSRDGGMRTFRSIRFPLRWAGQTMVGCISLDVTDSRDAQRALVVSQRRFEAIADAVDMHIWLAEPDLSRVLYTNRAYETIYGEPAERLLADPRSFLERVHPEDRSVVLEAATGLPRLDEHEFRIVRPDGVQRMLRARAFPVRDPGGQVVAIAGVAQDVTSSRLERDQVDALARRFEDVIENMSDAFVALDREWRYTYVNRRAGEMFGREPADLVGRHIWTEFPDGVGQPFYDVYMRVMSERVPMTFEDYYAPWDRWFENRVAPTDEGISIFFQEITERKRLIGQLEEQAAHFDIANVLVRSPTDNRILYWNEGAQRLYGFTKEEALGQLAHELLRTRAPMSFEDLMAHLEVEGSWEGTVTRTRKDGKRLNIALRSVLQRDSAGRAAAIVEVATDISNLVSTERERDDLRARLTQADRLDSLGQLAGGVAHDFNNLLGVILSNLGFALEATPPESPARADVEEALRAAERATGLTHQLLVFARHGQSEIGPVDLNAVINDMTTMLRRLIGEHVEVRPDLDPDLPFVEADRTQIEQAIVNLIVNAGDAMPDGGVVTISTRSEISGSRDGRDVVLDVADTGAGMTADVLEHALDPFFTTKAPGRGTGLGLATVYGAVTQAGGGFEIHSEPGSGTAVTLRLPASERSLIAPEVLSDVASGPSTGGTILVVDDEPSLRRVARRILERSGYQVLDAAGVAEAIEVAKEARGAVSLALIDLRLPDGSGADLAARITGRWPRTRVVFVSGYSGEVDTGDLRGELVAKPYRSEDLLAAIERALGRRRGD
ncbi:MAG: PAS domain S-box protein [Actinomycetota bacterium]